MAAGMRADQLLVERGIVETRAKGQALILAGLVFCGDKKVEKAGQPLKPDALLQVRGKDHPWVSRGGIKLAHGLHYFGWTANDAVAIDVGSSTGGFTDVLLANGAVRVYAVDSGTNQLAWKLRQDSRVTVLEQTNARNLTATEIPEPIDIVVCDASFISLTKVLPAALGFAKIGAKLVALIKPQFEAGRGEVGKGGVVRDPIVHQRVCTDVQAWIQLQGWISFGITTSPITGPEGNIEFLIGAVKAAQSAGND